LNIIHISIRLNHDVSEDDVRAQEAPEQKASSSHRIEKAAQ